MIKLIALFSFVLMLVSTAQAQPIGISPTLAPESELALRLAFAFGIVNTNNAIEAEDRLAEQGISPSVGWIDFLPVTPLTLSELQVAIGAAANEGRLPTVVNDVEAFGIFNQVVDEFGLAYSMQAAGATAPVPNQTDIDNYYAANGAPIYTYYAPPAAYFGLYTWLPCPFYFGSFWWPGYWMLRDFHRPYIWRGHAVYISNHYMGRDGRVVILDPAHRGTWIVHGRGFGVPRGRGAMPHVVPNHGFGGGVIPGGGVHVIHGGGHGGGHGGHHR